MSSDGNHVLVVGGTWGDTSVNGAGSHSRIFHIDVTPMLSSPSTGRPVISILASTLPAPIEGCVAGLTQGNAEINVFGGARYFNSELSYPISYSPLTIEVEQAVLEAAPASSSSSCSSSGSSLSGGQIAGIVVGSILGTAIIVAFSVWLALRSAGGSTLSHYKSHTDSSSEMSSRA